MAVSVAPSIAPRPSRWAPLRGLLDLIAVLLAVYALWYTTPVGGLMSKSWAFLSGGKARTKPLVAYFRTRSDGGELPSAVLKLLRRADPASLTAGPAQKAGLDPALARALAMINANGKTDATGHFEVSLSETGVSSFAAVSQAWPKAAAAAEREAALFAGVARLEKRLGSTEAAVTALVVDLAQVHYAQERARAAGRQEGARFEAFGPYLSARARSAAGPLVHGTFALSIAYRLRWPVDLNARVSSPFGERVHPVLGVSQRHSGVDLAVATGTPVRAIAPGVVIISGVDGINGKFVKIDHGHGLVSAYCHGSALEVSRGAEVAKGALVITSGATGRVSGPHLHFQLELDGTPIDPELFRPSSASAAPP